MFSLWQIQARPTPTLFESSSEGETVYRFSSSQNFLFADSVLRLNVINFNGLALQQSQSFGFTSLVIYDSIKYFSKSVSETSAIFLFNVSELRTVVKLFSGLNFTESTQAVNFIASNLIETLITFPTRNVTDTNHNFSFVSSSLT